MNKSIPAIIGGNPAIKYKFKNANYIGIEEKRAVNRVLNSGILSGFIGAWVPEFYGGKEVLRLEKNWSKYFKVRHSVSMNSATSCLIAAIGALNIQPGDEVIIPPTTMTASAAAILFYNAIPVFVDICPNTFCIDPNKLEKSITKKTKAIVVVNIYGQTAAWKKIKKIARKYNLIVIEDAAQAMGAYFKNQHAGTFGKISAFSTHPFKNLNGLGDGGFIITNEKRLYDKIKLYRNHGLRGRDNVEMIGVNSRLDSLNAEVLNYRLKKLNNVINKRQKNINLYKKLIKTKKVNIISENSDKKNTNVMFIALCEKRYELQKYLKKFNVQALVYYKNLLYSHKATRYLNINRKNFPVANSLVKKVLAFPHHQYLKRNEIEFECKKINNFYKK